VNVVGQRISIDVYSIKYIKDGSGLPGPGRKGGPVSKVTNKSKFLSQNSRGGDTTRSMPSSPNLVGMGSPLVGPASVPLSQQNADKAKTARKPIVHLLALGPATKKELREKIDRVPDQEFENVLAKVGDLNESTGKYELRKNFFKELDVWTFKYDSSEDRQKAIDNAVKTYDKMRLGLSEPEWDRLLVRAERGTGKHLSKLQAQIAAGPIARPPKINVERAEGSGRDTPSGKDEDSFSDKNISKVKGESMSRSISQPPNTKAKKPSEKEAQTKRLLSKNPSKAAPANKPAPTKKAPQSKTSSKVLSSEFVNDSDEDDDYPPATKPPAKASIKRSREEDDVETSDSSVPLAKKVKKETPSSHRISDASQSSRTTHTSHYSSGSSKKDTSPQKSSPLATSPPTNASEFENSSSGGRTSSSTSPAHHPSTKNTRSPIHKRHQKSSSVASSTSSSSSTRYLKSEVVDIARKYKLYYPRYEELHRELMEIGEHRDKGKEELLLEMHERLAGMKAQIMAGIVMEDTN
jgi:RNA polymerase II elongation factor ELL